MTGKETCEAVQEEESRAGDLKAPNNTNVKDKPA